MKKIVQLLTLGITAITAITLISCKKNKTNTSSRTKNFSDPLIGKWKFVYRSGPLNNGQYEAGKKVKNGKVEGSGSGGKDGGDSSVITITFNSNGQYIVSYIKSKDSTWRWLQAANDSSATFTGNYTYSNQNPTNRNENKILILKDAGIDGTNGKNTQMIKDEWKTEVKNWLPKFTEALIDKEMDMDILKEGLKTLANANEEVQEELKKEGTTLEDTLAALLITKAKEDAMQGREALNKLLKNTLTFEVAKKEILKKLSIKLREEENLTSNILTGEENLRRLSWQLIQVVGNTILGDKTDTKEIYIVKQADKHQLILIATSKNYYTFDTSSKRESKGVALKFEKVSS